MQMTREARLTPKVHDVQMAPDKYLPAFRTKNTTSQLICGGLNPRLGYDYHHAYKYVP